MPSSPTSRSLGRKLNLVLVATIVFALSLAAVALVMVDLRAQSRSIEDDLAAQADIVGLASTAALAFEDAKGGLENLKALRAIPSVAVAALYLADGRQLAAFAQDPSTRAPAAAPAHRVEMDPEWIRLARPVMLERERIGTVYLQSRHNLRARAIEHLWVLLAIMCASLAAALPLASRLHRRVTAPLLELRGVAQGIMHGDFGLRARRTTEDEIGELVDAFNSMVEELRRRERTLQQANGALRASEERYQLAVRGASAGLWDWDLRAGTMFYSQRLKSLLGYTDEQFPNVPGSIRKVADEEQIARVRDALRQHFSDGRPYQVEIRVRLRSGEERWLLLAGASLRDEHGEAFRMAGSVIDITERKEAEDVLREANRAKDEFLATLAHELRNPLAPIRTCLEILKLDPGADASLRARQTIERQLLHMIRLIDDLLDISRITSGKIRIERVPMLLRTAVEGAIEISRPAIEAGEHELQVSFNDPDLRIEGDTTRIAQSVGNLLNNAAKYTPRGGRIALRVGREGGEAVIEVSDNGLGIPPEMLEKVFAMFTQVGKTLDRAQGGLGIGLSLVRKLVELHGGSVRADSAGPGMGSTFTIRLPCLAPQPAADPEPPGAVSVMATAQRPLRVLVADDNVDAAETMAAMLQMLGYPARSVNDPAAVLESAEFGADVMLLDIGMPSMSGYELARRLRADPRFAGVLLVAVTGWGSEADRGRARDAGFDHHLTKPVNLDELAALLARRSNLPSQAAAEPTT